MLSLTIAWFYTDAGWCCRGWELSPDCGGFGHLFQPKRGGWKQLEAADEPPPGKSHPWEGGNVPPPAPFLWDTAHPGFPLQTHHRQDSSSIPCLSRLLSILHPLPSSSPSPSILLSILFHPLLHPSHSAPLHHQPLLTASTLAWPLIQTNY